MAAAGPPIGCTGLNEFDEHEVHDARQRDRTAATRSARIVEKNEHCNAFVYYYPKQDNVNCF